MFRKSHDSGYKNVIDKIRRRTLAYGEKTLMAEFTMGIGAGIPEHSHPHEQSGYLVSGRLELAIGNEIHTAEPGDSWCIAGNVVHSAVALKDSVAIEVFSPVREDYLP